MLKAMAWDQRHEDRDLVDLARLALWDVEGRGVRAEVDALLARLAPAARRAVRRTAAAFASGDDSGPGAFWREFLQHVVGIDPDTLEDEIRSLVSGAVRRLLDAA